MLSALFGWDVNTAAAACNKAGGGKRSLAHTNRSCKLLVALHTSCTNRCRALQVYSSVKSASGALCRGPSPRICSHSDTRGLCGFVLLAGGIVWIQLWCKILPGPAEVWFLVWIVWIFPYWSKDKGDQGKTVSIEFRMSLKTDCITKLLRVTMQLEA